MNPGCNWPSRQSWEFHGSAVIPTVIDNHALSVRLSEQVPNALETSYICLRKNVNLLQQEWHPAAAELLKADQSCPDHLKPPVIPQEPLILLVFVSNDGSYLSPNSDSIGTLEFFEFFTGSFSIGNGKLPFLNPIVPPGRAGSSTSFSGSASSPWLGSHTWTLFGTKTEDPEVLLQKGFSKLDPLNSSTMLHGMHKSS